MSATPLSKLATISYQSTTNSKVKEVKLYKRRWLLMGIYMIYSIDCAMQWMQLTVINDKVQSYYGESGMAVDMTVQIFIISYILFLVPTFYCIEKFGIRFVMITASTGLTLGTWIKLLSVYYGGFYLLMTGQIIISIIYVLNFGMSARFTALWFGAKEIAFAGSAALIGDQIGAALGLLIPPLLISESNNATEEYENTKNGMKTLHLISGSIATLSLIFIFIFFKSTPKTPPSIAQIVQIDSHTENLLSRLLDVLSSPGFIIVGLSYTLAVTVLNTILTFLNELFLQENFDNQDAGNIGFIIQMVGMLNSILISFILDKTRRFRENSIILTVGGTFAVIMFFFSLKVHNKLLIYVAGFFLGFFIQSYYPTGPQICIEMTYPVPEGISTGILFLFVQIGNLIVSPIYGYFVRYLGDVVPNCALFILMILSIIFAALTPSNMKRQNVETMGCQ